MRPGHHINVVGTNAYRRRKIGSQIRVFPRFGKPGLVVLRLQAQGGAAVSNGAGKEAVADADRRRGAFEQLVLERERPVRLAIRRVDRSESLAGKDDELPRRSITNQDRRGVTGRVIQALPDDSALCGIESDYGCALRTNVEIDAAGIDQRRTRSAKDEPGRGEFLAGVDLPEDLPVRTVEAAQHAGDAERVDLAIGHGRRGAGAVAVEAGERRTDVRRPPQFLTRGGIVGGHFLDVLAFPGLA